MFIGLVRYSGHGHVAAYLIVDNLGHDTNIVEKVQYSDIFMNWQVVIHLKENSTFWRDED